MSYTPSQSPKSATSTQTSPSRYSKATHLTEFYPYLNGGQIKKEHSRQSSTNSITTGGHGDGPSPRSRGGPGSDRRPSFSTMNSFNSFSPSTLDLQTLVTKTDINKTTEAYNEILSTSKEYRDALLKVSEAAGNFGAALENGAKCKGSGNSADGLLSASGLYFLVANHQQILAHSVKNSFEEPILKEINQFKLKTSKNDEIFKNNIKEKITLLKKQEYENSKLSKLKTRNLITYRSKLQQLTSHIDEIDKVKHDYYQSSFDLVQDTSQNILKQVGSIVRAQVEIYEGIARKGWSGGGLDELLAGCPDPFTNEDDDDDYDNGRYSNNGNDDNDDNNDNNDNKLEEPQYEDNDNDNDDIDDDDDDTIGPIPQLKPQSLSSTTNGLFIQSKSSTSNPTLSHSTSTKSFEKTLNSNDVLHSSTPRQFSPEPNNIDDSFDDNSFSLPLPGSSSRNNIKSTPKEIDNSSPKKEADHELKEDDEDQGSPATKLRKELYPSHSEWNSDQDTSGNESEIGKLGAGISQTSLPKE
ncbi:hypothetical protein BN7_2476 [Wickerhamomyces ciferrii]|uniref:Protein IVY1 n=1 Tax=Wickerhamomyces ciferrii (strain ATCC 14091 / BCRC 22168 / CBS 111 / JCM 3599 / NBRC 0793 / NRRL Y-1031 F-60-10) TaxID=1206466 RepID=K0KCV4_WICCF|nr:uncharacterized protein BN7_2476 [Wickerhamomyces ciferrii]CCH42930.1 hypothetical protein BN7_2476 [Wickerhamomyces ciferrii]